MTTHITTKNKLLLAFGLNAFFYGVVLYIHLDGEQRTWRAVTGELAPTIASEYILGSLIIFGWLFAAEFIHEWFERRFGEDILSSGALLPNVAAVLVFAAANVVFHRFGLVFIYQAQALMLEAPNYHIVDDNPYSRMSIRFNYANYIILALFVYYLLIHRRITHYADEVSLRAEKAEKEKAEMQYMLLRNRINPHFLFNSLSTLASLVQVDGDRSVRFIDRMSKAYRYMLESRDRQTVSLQEELSFLEAYTHVQQERFLNKLHLHIHMPPGVAQKAQLLPLTLQMLAERIMKNNRMSVQTPLVITIVADEDEIRIRYNRQPRLEPDGTIGDWRRTVLEDRYAVLQPEGRPLREVKDDRFCTIHVPLWYDTAGLNPAAA